MSWLKELNDRKCPATLQEVRDDIARNGERSVWEEPDDGWFDKIKVGWFHDGATSQVRSKPTSIGKHSNQCTYDKNERLIRHQRPAAGTADFKACYDRKSCFGAHKLHDVDTYNLAEKLNRVDDYYSVRPTIY